MVVKLRVVFGRHGVSCANVIKKTSSVLNLSRFLYIDPELSHSGREQLDKLQPAFMKKIKKEKTVVCASGLIRAQQTAYGLTKANTVYIVPHIAELGMTYDNQPLPKEKQEKILKETCHEELISHRNFDYYISDDKSNFNKFKKWFGTHWSRLSKRDPSCLFLFFSHGRFIRKMLKSLPGTHILPDMKNYECVELLFTVDDEIVTHIEYVGTFDYAPLPEMDTSLDCTMDTCIKPSCQYWSAVRLPPSKRCSVTRKKSRRF